MSIREHTLRRKPPHWWDLGCAPLDQLSPRTRRELCRAGDVYTVWPGQTLLAEGGLVSWVFIVLEGELALTQSGREERVLRAGCLYGGLESLARGHAPADLVARDVSRVLALPVTAYTGVVATHNDFASWVLHALARQEAAA